MERKRMYEYAERFAHSGRLGYIHYDSKEELEMERASSSVLVRREVGEWEEFSKIRRDDGMEREKQKCEYAEKTDDGHIGRIHEEEAIDGRYLLEGSVVVRREVGEWEEVSND